MKQLHPLVPDRFLIPDWTPSTAVVLKGVHTEIQGVAPVNLQDAPRVAEIEIYCPDPDRGIHAYALVKAG